MVRGPQLAIFDCDGVLVDSELMSTAVLAAELSAAGLPTTAERAHEEYRGMLLADIAERVRERCARPLPGRFWDRFEAARARAFESSLQPVPGAGDAVRAVRALGIPVCVASQGRLRKTELTLGLTGLRDLFGEGALFSAYDVARGKPHPDLFLHAARSMGAEPAGCVVIEDTAIGVQAARSAGMGVIGLARDDEDPAPLRRLGATTIGSLDELAPLLASRLLRAPEVPSSPGLDSRP